MKRSSWIDILAGTAGIAQSLTPEVRRALSDLDDLLFGVWNLGDNIILVWTRAGGELRFLAVRHYAIVEVFHTGSADAGEGGNATEFINGILSGPKFVQQQEFEKLCRILGSASQVVAVAIAPGAELQAELVSSLVARYGVSLVREKAVVLLDAVGFSLRTPLEQVAMLNSLSYSVNSAHSQLLSKDVHIDFARTTTGDGFYIWNRDRTEDANVALYKLMMLILTDNAVAQRKAKHFPVPRLRAAFHVGEYYEFFQVEALNPTTFGYIVGQVTIELSRILEQALPGQILLGEFDLEMSDARNGKRVRCNTLDFIEQTAVTLDQIRGLEVAGDCIEDIRCYLTGEATAGNRFQVSRYPVLDKHGMSRAVYNAKINLHLLKGEPIFLGVRHAELHPPGAPAWPERK